MTAPTSCPARNTCPKCGVTIEPTPCTCGASHVGTYCWPCHHARVSSCAAPHCPEHGVVAAGVCTWCRGTGEAWSTTGDAPVPCPACGGARRLGGYQPVGKDGPIKPPPRNP